MASAIGASSQSDIFRERDNAVAVHLPKQIDAQMAFERSLQKYKNNPKISFSLVINAEAMDFFAKVSLSLEIMRDRVKKIKIVASPEVKAVHISRLADFIKGCHSIERVSLAGIPHKQMKKLQEVLPKDKLVSLRRPIQQEDCQAITQEGYPLLAKLDVRESDLSYNDILALLTNLPRLAKLRFRAPSDESPLRMLTVEQLKSFSTPVVKDMTEAHMAIIEGRLNPVRVSFPLPASIVSSSKSRGIKSKAVAVTQTGSLRDEVEKAKQRLAGLKLDVSFPSCIDLPLTSHEEPAACLPSVTHKLPDYTLSESCDGRHRELTLTEECDKCPTEFEAL